MSARNASAFPVLGLATNEPWQKAVNSTHHMFVQLSASAMAAASIMLAPLIDLFYGNKQSAATDSGGNDGQSTSLSSQQTARDARARQQLSMVLAISPSTMQQPSPPWNNSLHKQALSHQLSFFKPPGHMRSNAQKPQHALKYRTPPSFLPRAFLRGVQMIDLTPRYKRKTLVLDLDETLIRSVHDIGFPVPGGTSSQPDFSFTVCIERRNIGFDVYKRPCVDFFLDIVSQWYDLIIFTAALEPYGARIADHLDGGRRLFKRHYYRHHCSSLEYKGSTVLTKDLRQMFAGDLENVIIVDNSPWAYHLNNDNAIPIRSWYEHDAQDRELLKLLPILDALRFVGDVRTVLGAASRPAFTHMLSSSALDNNNVITSGAARGSKLLPLASPGPSSRSAPAYSSISTATETTSSLASIQNAINRLRTTISVIALSALATAKQQQQLKKRNDLVPSNMFTSSPAVSAVAADEPAAVAGDNTAA